MLQEQLLDDLLLLSTAQIFAIVAAGSLVCTWPVEVSGRAFALATFLLEDLLGCLQRLGAVTAAVKLRCVVYIANRVEPPILK